MDTVSSYIDRCTSICIPSWTNCVFPNQKPWFNADVRSKVRKRSAPFESGDILEYKPARYELQKTIRDAKRKSTQRLESCYRENNTGGMWQGIRSITNYRPDTNRTILQDNILPDNLSRFYAGSTSITHTTPQGAPCGPDETALQVTHAQVFSALKKVNPCKAAVAQRVLKACAKQLVEVYKDIFNTSLSQETVPRTFKSSEIVPVPKKKTATTMSNLRPVALTSAAMKCLEKLVLTYINSTVPVTEDPHQFAYRSHRSVEDAVALALHSVLRHLDNNNTYARLLFLDYS